MEDFDESDFEHLTLALQGIELMFVALGGVVPLGFMNPVIATLNDASNTADLRRHFDVNLVHFAIMEALMSFSSVVSNLDSELPTSPAHRFFDNADSTTAITELLVSRLILHLNRKSLADLQPSFPRLQAARCAERDLLNPPSSKRVKV